MIKLPFDLQQPIFKVILENGNLTDLESWIYQETKLANFLSAEDYLALISLDFEQNHALLEIKRIIDNYFNYLEYYNNELKQILLKLQANPLDLDSLSAIYDYYCRNYAFLGKLAIHYGLTAVMILDKDFGESDSFNSKDAEEIKYQAKLIYQALTEAKIVLLKLPDYQSDINYYQDFRSEEEKRLTDVTTQ